MGADFVSREYERLMAAGSGVLMSGGVTEAVLRRVASDKSARALKGLSMVGVRSGEGIRELTFEALGREVRIAIVSGLAKSVCRPPSAWAAAARACAYQWTARSSR